VVIIGGVTTLNTRLIAQLTSRERSISPWLRAMDTVSGVIAPVRPR